MPGILSLDMSEDTTRALTGGADKNAVVFESASEQVVTTLRGHTKKVTSVVYHNKEVCACACACVRVCVFVRACVRACV